LHSGLSRYLAVNQRNMSKTGVEEIQLKLIYANTDASREISVTMSSSVREVKKTIMDPNSWPTSLEGVEHVDEVRLFIGGKEVGGKKADESKNFGGALSEGKIHVNLNGVTAVHVYPSMRFTEVTEKEATKPSQCFCTLL